MVRGDSGGQGDEGFFGFGGVLSSDVYCMGAVVVDVRGTFDGGNVEE